MDTGLSRRAAWALALTATFTMAVSYVDRQTLAVLAPTVTAALGISDTNYGWLASAFSIAYLVGAPAAGLVVDRVGARRGLLGAVVLWSIVAALHAVVPGFGVLFVLRIALGLAESPSFPGAAQTVQRVLPPSDRPRGFALLFTGSSIGAMLAPPLATALERQFNWRVAFLVTAVVGTLWVPVWLRLAFTPQARALLDPTPRERDGASGRVGWFASVTHPAVLRAVVVVLTCSPVMAFVLIWSAKFLVRHYHVTQSDVGRYLWIPPVIFDVGTIAIGDLASRRARARGNDGRPDRALFVVATLLALCVLAIPLPATPLGSMLVAGLAMAGGGALFTLVNSDMMHRVSPATVSVSGGTVAAAQSLAYIVANPLIGREVDRVGHYRSVIWVLTLLVVPGALAWLFWPPPPSHAPRS